MKRQKRMAEMARFAAEFLHHQKGFVQKFAAPERRNFLGFTNRLCLSLQQGEPGISEAAGEAAGISHTPGMTDDEH